MTLVDQATDNDCVSACLASILDVSLDDVPQFVGRWGKLWRVHVVEWLRNRNLGLVEVDWDTFYGKGVTYYDGNYIALGEGPRGVKHAVVGRDFSTYFDPHKSRAGLVGLPESVLLITAGGRRGG